MFDALIINVLLEFKDIPIPGGRSCNRILFIFRQVINLQMLTPKLKIKGLTVRKKGLKYTVWQLCILKNNDCYVGGRGKVGLALEHIFNHARKHFIPKIGTGCSI